MVLRNVLFDKEDHKGARAKEKDVYEKILFNKEQHSLKGRDSWTQLGRTCSTVPGPGSASKTALPNEQHT